MNGNLAYREELMNGELAAMSPRPAFNHNHIAFKIAVLFDGLDISLYDIFDGLLP